MLLLTEVAKVKEPHHRLEVPAEHNGFVRHPISRAKCGHGMMVQSILASISKRKGSDKTFPPGSQRLYYKRSYGLSVKGLDVDRVTVQQITTSSTEKKCADQGHP